MLKRYYQKHMFKYTVMGQYSSVWHILRVVRRFVGMSKEEQHMCKLRCIYRRYDMRGRQSVFVVCR